MRSVSGKDGRKRTSVLTESRSAHGRPVVGSSDSTASRALGHVPPLNMRQNLFRNLRKLIVVYPFWTSLGFRYHDAPMSSSSAMEGSPTTWLAGFPSTMTSPEADGIRPSYCVTAAGMCRSSALGWGFTATWRPRNATVDTSTTPVVVRAPRCPSDHAVIPSATTTSAAPATACSSCRESRATTTNAAPHTQASDRTRRAGVTRVVREREAATASRTTRGTMRAGSARAGHRNGPMALGPRTHRMRTTVDTHTPARSRDDRRSRPRSSHRTTGSSQAT